MWSLSCLKRKFSVGWGSSILSPRRTDVKIWGKKNPFPTLKFFLMGNTFRLGEGEAEGRHLSNSWVRMHDAKSDMGKVLNHTHTASGESWIHLRYNTLFFRDSSLVLQEGIKDTYGNHNNSYVKMQLPSALVAQIRAQTLLCAKACWLPKISPELCSPKLTRSCLSWPGYNLPQAHC